MKKKIHKILGVGLAFMLAASLMVAFVPVAAAADYEENDWGDWGMPALEPDTDVGPMAIAPDGTIFAAVLDWSGDSDVDDWVWIVQMSEDDGYTWDDTDLELDAYDGGGWIPENGIAQIVVSPNYEDDETFYVGTFGGTVYRCEEAGDTHPIAIKNITGDPDLYSIDIWFDGDDNWIMAGTEDDVFVIRDAPFGTWIAQELGEPGYEVNFAPDFDDSELIWVITEVWNGTDNQDNFLITSTVAPGQWGQVIGEVELDSSVVGDGVEACAWVDLGFPDDYSSDVDEEVPILFAALSDYDDDGDGGVYYIEGVESPSDSVATDLKLGTNMVSLAVSGDAENAIMLAGALQEPTVWIGTDGGLTWDIAVDKNPTGQYPFPPMFGPNYPGSDFTWMEILMEADVVWGGEVFDEDEGMAFVATFGWESAVSRSEDGGQAWNQVGLIDTVIDDIYDLGFNPDDSATFMMSTVNYGMGPTSLNTSLWLTLNGDEEEPDFVRVLCGNPYGAPGNFGGWFGLVDWSWDGDAIYLAGTDDDVAFPPEQSVIWKSTNDGATFSKKRSVKDDAFIVDWEIPDDRTIYAATMKASGRWYSAAVAAVPGFARTINSGLSWSSVDVGGDMNDIALSPDFDDDETILMGSVDGDVYVSTNGGDTFKDTKADTDADSDFSDNVVVAFDADYADEDADGFELIYAADDDGSNPIAYAEQDGTDTNWKVLEDDTWDDATDNGVFGYFYGLVVSEDNALYAIANTADYEADPDEVLADDPEQLSNVIGVVRVLLDESNSLWEEQNDGNLDAPWGLWLTPGSNVLWTIDMAGDADFEGEFWALEDTCSGQVTLDSPADGYRSEAEEDMRVAWDEVRDAEEYQVKYTHVATGTANTVQPDDTDVLLTELRDTSEYDWKVRVAPGEPWHSRWSDTRSFHTALGKPPWTPTLYTPGGVWQYSGIDVDLMPAFSWESAKSADGYQFVLADNAEFTSPLVNKKTSESAYNLDFELEYNTNYFWRVMAYKGNDAISRWSDIGAFTTIETAAPAPPAPAPPATVTQPAPAPIVLPTPIPPALLWVIIGIGALLIIAVIVLIVRTRRPI